MNRAKTIYITASNYLGHDAPFELLKAVNDFNSGDKSKTTGYLGMMSPVHIFGN